MSAPLHVQVTVDAPADAVFDALTDSSRLGAWFAEHADAALHERRYDFWGRWTPEAPDREQGRHPLIGAEPAQRLAFGWRVCGDNTSVAIGLHPQGYQTVVAVRHDGVSHSHAISRYTFEDFWFLSCENLRRHLDGRAPVRCDFSAPMLGDIRHTVEIDGPPGQVFEALIRPEQLERWIASSATVEPKAGGRYEFGWQMGGPVKILDLTPDERLAYSWPEETETIVTWTLEGSGGKTRLTIVHSGFAPDKPTGGYNTGWLNFLSWIKSIVEYGPEWTSPLIPLADGMESYYAASIRAGQAKLILGD
jgi:uncharacterized protein YndB with AHSA1/START domain